MELIPFREFLLEFTTKDMSTAGSDFMKRNKEKRQQTIGGEMQHLKLAGAEFFPERGLVVTFTTKPTKGVGECYDIGKGKFYKDDKYTMKVLYEKYKNIEDFEEENGKFVNAEDVKLTCNCRAFHWQGMNYHASELGSSVTPTKIPDNYWKFFHNKDGAICKHLSGLLDNVGRFESRVYNACNKAKFKK
jgi:hypothetical protein